MPLRFLMVGPSFHGAAALRSRAERSGCMCHVVETCQEARSLTRVFQFDCVLAKEYLPDGQGYELTAEVLGRQGSLYVAVALSDSSLWLPAVEHGRRCLGDTALSQEVFLGTMEELFQSAVSQETKEQNHEATGPESAAFPIQARASIPWESVALRDLSECLLEAYDAVACRADELLQQRGENPGDELEDWRRAEDEVLQKIPIHVQESDLAITALISVPGYSAAEKGLTRAGSLSSGGILPATRRLRAQTITHSLRHSTTSPCAKLDRRSLLWCNCPRSWILRDAVQCCTTACWGYEC